MSLEKSISHGKEHRKPYYDSRGFDWSCRAHGSCGWCYRNRKGKDIKKLCEWTKSQLEEVETNLSNYENKK